MQELRQLKYSLKLFAADLGKLDAERLVSLDHYQQPKGN
jgi:hypothetical protein